MRTSRYIVFSVLAVALTAGCGDTEPGSAAAPTSAVGVTGADTLMARAHYGVVADLRLANPDLSFGADAKVYVFLRKAGQRMPLAVQHFAASELPRTVSFSTAGPESGIELVARLSFSGRVERDAGDLESSQTLAVVGHPPETISLMLGQAAPTVSSVRVRLTADPSVSLPPDSPVFVIARAPGSPMPLAVKKLTLRDLPTEVELSDEDAMMFTNRLSLAPKFTLAARINRSGSAAHSPDDVESPTIAVSAGALPDKLDLVIGEP